MNDATFVGIEHGMRDVRKRSTEDTGIHLGVLVGTIQRRECRNDDLHLVFRELPILGSESMLAARAVLASRAQGLYEPFHWALLGADGPFDCCSASKFDPSKSSNINGLERRSASNPRADQQVYRSFETPMPLAWSGKLLTFPATARPPETA